ncbi:MAG: hypothetical protein JWR83_2737 [Aeromicrobium sp.]|nr:hypothetical protein [Aeromicrobium sp.]
MVSTVSGARRRRRVVAVAVAFGLLALVGPAVSTANAGDDTSVTVNAPGTGPDAKVTVSRTSNLVNQTVAVQWQGFTPSSADELDNSTSFDVNTSNPVRVYECRGDSSSTPASSSECYGSPGFSGIPASDTTPAVPAVSGYTYPGKSADDGVQPDGPPNWQDTVTSDDGTGEVSIQLFTKRESSSLGCDIDTPCSIVVVPNYGRSTGNGDTELDLDAPWAWARRTVIPLHFLSVADACPLTGDSLRVEGTPFLAHALASWRAKSCVLDTNPVRVDYTAIGEPQTRDDFGAGTTDVGLTIDPLTAESAANRGAVYAPVSITGLVVAFQIDDRHGRQVRNLNLNARLVAKLITASYRTGLNSNTPSTNPVNIFRDPEFLALNPGVDWPSGAPGNHPLLLGDLSDSTLALTKWIAADKKASAFISGKADEWGMTVNKAYKKQTLPFASFPVLDENQANSFVPIQDLDILSRQLSIAQFPGGDTSVEGGVTVTTKPARQNPGRREVIGIIDAAAAANFRLSTAALQNASGTFVKPDNTALLAGVKHSKVHADGVTRTVDQTSKNTAIYPLTLTIAAALSTKASKADRTSMAHLLDYITGPGQVPGDNVGNLPDGHAPLTASLLAQVAKARKAVLAGYVAPTENSAAGSSGSAGDSGVGTDAPSDTATPKSGDPNVALTGQMIAIKPEATSHRLVALPLILAAALVALLSGPTVVLIAGSSKSRRGRRR